MYGVYFNVDTDADAVECALTFIVNMHWLLNYLGINRVRIPYTASPGLNVYSVEYPYNVNVRYQEPNRDWSMYKASSYTASPWIQGIQKNPITELSYEPRNGGDLISFG